MASMCHEEGNPVVRMMPMQSSSSEESYARNSSFQNYNFHAVAKPRLANALKQVAFNIISARNRAAIAHSGCDGLLIRQQPHIAIADVGCSYGRNTLDYAEFVLCTLQQSWHAGKDDHEGASEMEIEYFFSDLPSNDFNALFQSLQPYLYQNDGVDHTGENSWPVPKIFAAGVPGSFYGRVFPSSSLDLVICSYSLHWLSQAPPSIFDKASLAWNGGHTWINKASPSVVDAYAQQSKLDMKSFLKCRALELAHGGVMFLVMPARAVERDCLSGPYDFIPLGSTWELFDFAFKEMVDEGTLTVDEMDMFNMPLYLLDQQEFESVLMEVSELDVLHLETLENLALFQEQKDKTHAVQQWMGMVSSIIRPLLEAQLDTFRAGEVLKKIENIASKQDCFNATITHNLVIASLQCGSQKNHILTSASAK